MNGRHVGEESEGDDKLLFHSFGDRGSRSRAEFDFKNGPDKIMFQSSPGRRVLSDYGNLCGIAPAAVELGKEALPTLSR